MRSHVLASFILALGVIGAGYCIGDSITNFKKFDRYVEVKGLDERIVKSDAATWNLNFTVSNNDIKRMYENVSTAQNLMLQFLHERGFKDTEIQKQPLTTIDNLAGNYSNFKNISRYSATAGIIVNTADVDKVAKTIQEVDSLVKSGILVNNSYVRYSFTNLNSIKPEMLEKATANARDAANTFAKNSQSHVGKIRRATQGLFSITGVGGGDFYNDETSLMKKVRVVTSVDFFIL